MHRSGVTLLFVAFVLQSFTNCNDVVNSCKNCSYKWNAGQLYANCSGRNLSNFPFFNASVTHVDLSHNNISNISIENLPKNLLTLDLSFNCISKIEGNAFQRLYNLLSLNVSGNALTNDSVSEFAFRGLKKLETLSVKAYGHHGNGYGHYLVNSIKYLSSLRTLCITGQRDGMFPEEYKHLHHLQVLDLSGKSDAKCGLSHIKSNFFENLLILKEIDLSFCEIKTIESLTFESLPFLRRLDLTYNEELTFSVLPNITHDLQNTSIETLVLDKIHCTFGIGTEILLSHTLSLRNTSLKYLSIASNRVTMVESGVIRNLPVSLSNISVADNSFTKGKFIFEIGSLKNLIEANVSSLFSIHTPGTLIPRCNDTYRPNCPKRKIIHTTLMTQRYKQATTSVASNPQVPPFPPPKFIIYLPPSLETLYGQNSNLKFRIHRWQIGSNNSLKNLYLQHNILYSLVGPVKGLDKLEFLNISFNFCSYISTQFFLYTRNLKYLYMQNNLIGFSLNRDESGNTFRSLLKLEILDLSNNRIRELPQNLFRHLKNLKHLILQSNLIQRWEIDISKIENLKLLDISSNQIQMLSKENIKNLAKFKHLTINLSNNPFLCTCDSIYFLKWILQDKRRIINGGGINTTCSFSNGTVRSLADLTEVIRDLEKECSSYTALILGCTSIVILFITVVVTGLVYRYRWKLRYLYYMAKRKYRYPYQALSVAGYRNVYNYDAFISYADGDRSFVLEEMIPVLEEENNLSLCIHHRDFLPGVEIAENICDAIHQSKKTVCVLSNAYLDSHWCMYELNMARMESIYSRNGENALCIILLGEVNLDIVPLDLMNFIHSKTYIDYPGEPEGNIVFWNKIVETISL